MFPSLEDEDEEDLLGDGIPVPKAPLAMTRELFAQRAALTSWREPLLFLAEKLADRPADTLTLRKWLFPIRKSDTEPLPMPAQQLLATFSVDPQVSLTLEQRQPIWDYLCRAHLENKESWFRNVLSSLLIPSEYNSAIFSRLVDLADKMKVKRLFIGGCSGLSNLNGLQELSGLQNLSLVDCPEVSDLSVLQGLNKLKVVSFFSCPELGNLNGLQGLSSLQSLDLRGCPGVSDLSGLQGLSSLQRLDLRGCPGVSDLSVLQGLSSLQSLYLSGCPGVSEPKRQVADLKKALPKLTVYV